MRIKIIKYATFAALLLSGVSFSLTGCDMNSTSVTPSDSNSTSVEVTSTNVDITISGNTNSANRIISPDEITLSHTLSTIESMNYYNTQVMPSTGNVNMLVVPVGIPGYDAPFYNPYTGVNDISASKIIEDINMAFFGTDNPNGYESVASFYEKSSYGKLHIGGVVTDWFDASLYYDAATDIDIADVEELTDTIVSWIKSSGTVNIADYDSDNDGYIDALWLVYACPDYTRNGPRTDNQNYWAYTYWANQDTAGDPSSPIANVYGWASYDFLYDTLTSGAVTANTFIHETGHFLGLKDYYSDTNSYNPVGKVDMMDANIIDHNSYSKMLLGWTKPYVVLGNGTINLKSMQNENSLIVIPSDSYTYVDGTFDPFGEYILIELYSNEGLNEKDSKTKYSATTPQGVNATGARIYHVDKRLFYVDTSSEYNIVCVPYTGVGQRIDSTHHVISPMSNNRGADQYNTALNFSTDYLLFDELRLIERNGKDTFSSGGYQTARTLFGENSSFSLRTYSAFFSDNAMNDGSTFSTSISIGEIKEN